LLAATVLLGACAAAPPPRPDPAELQRQVMQTERAFAKTMADRDHAAFSAFLGEEAIFFSGPHETLHGKQAVAEAWQRYFDKPTAPFSWEPDEVEVLDSGTLALSTGPVHDRQGKLIGTFNSIWRQEAPGVWRIVFDKGSEVCN
jgi:ketosteroid isomerase-like protein